MTECRAPGCDEPHYGRGLCKLHYMRVRHHGSFEAKKKPNGDRFKWINSVAVKWESDECLLWPFPVASHGYGMFAVDKKKWNAHRYVCQIFNGPSPSAGMDAAHSCGIKRCINHRHLRWATRTDNMADCLGHGTRIRGETHGASKLTKDDVLAIRRATETHREIAKKFGVANQTVSDIKAKKTWTWL